MRGICVLRVSGGDKMRWVGKHGAHVADFLETNLTGKQINVREEIIKKSNTYSFKGSSPPPLP